MEEKTPEKVSKGWSKTPLGILILLAFWPFSLSWWIWKRNWNLILKLGILLILWVIILSIGYAREDTRKAFKEGFEAGQGKVPESSPTPAPTQRPVITPRPTATSTPAPRLETPTPTSTPAPVDFDENLGNNFVAAKYAQDIMNTANKAVPDTLTKTYLELSPEDMKGKNEEDYKKSVTTASLTATINNLYWSSFDEDSKKDVVASLVVAVGNIFPQGYPHIHINNGVRTVAEGEYDWLKTEPKVTLK